MTRANRLIGLPVVREGRRLGVVDAVSYSRCGKRLAGLHVQGNALRSGYLSAESISLLGENAVLSVSEPTGRGDRFTLRRVRDTSGLKLGVVTDALLDETALSVEALELSFGPIDDLLQGRRWVNAFSVDPKSGDVIIPCDAWLEAGTGRSPALFGCVGGRVPD
ncbi:MAG: hypothetical protein LBS72_00485 [Oscillospiraceae bacterium]|jgi:uncharacterized protein YrrD|nr:hypothetical protein [Oscillospiraceae bacterium]